MLMGFPGGSVGKETAYSAGDTRVMGSIPGLGRSPGGGHGRGNSSILAWRIPWTEEPGGLQSIGHKELDTSEVTDCSILLLNVKKSSIK